MMSSSSVLLKSKSLVSSSSAIRWAAGGWTFFIIENLILSENRTWIINQLGDDGYHGAYGLCSTIAMGSVGYAYVKKINKFTPPLISNAPTPQGKIIAWLLLSCGSIMASQAAPKLQIPVQYKSKTTTNANSISNNSNDISVLSSSSSMPSSSAQPTATIVATTAEAKDTTAASADGGGGGSWQVRCPFDFTDAKMKKKESTTGNDEELYGLERISRHPGLWSFGLLGFGYSFLLKSIPQRIFFTMPMFVALIGGEHTDSRYRRNMGGTLQPKYDNMTSNIPFLAMITGKQESNSFIKLIQNELKPLNALLAVTVTTLWVISKGKVRPR